jgi:ABC-type molybdate transport system substrate-binding protein
MIPGLNTLAAKIAAGAALSALIALAVVWMLYKAETRSHDRTRASLATEQARHAVTRQSVDTLDAVIEDLNERALARAEAYAAAQGVAAKRSAELAELSRESDKRIAALRQAAREQYNGDCPVPDAIRELAEGL